MATSREDRISILKSIAVADVSSILFITLGFFLLKHTGLFQPVTHGKAVAFSLVIATYPLALGLLWAASTRFFVQNLDGSDPEPGTPLDITRRYLQNTLEQTVLFALAAIAFFFAAPEFSASLLPVMAVWFFIARALFWIGYRSANTLNRAIGFAASFHPSLCLLLAALVLSLLNTFN